MAFGKFGRYHPDGAEVRPTTVEVVGLVCRAIEDVCRSTPSADGRVLFKPNMQRCELVSDPLHIRHIVANLVQNALKYSPPECQVIVELEATGDGVELRVRDRGIGVPEDEIELIFSPFFRSENARQKEGGGLGLAIVKRSAKLVGAKIGVATRLGAGSVFTVAFPAAPEPQEH